MRDLCAICRENGSDVSCLLCSTPHHRDCWSYNRKCSRYGCSSVHNSDQLHEFQKTYRLGLSFSYPENLRNIEDEEDVIPNPLRESVQVVCWMMIFLAAVVFGIVCVAEHVDQINRSHPALDDIIDVAHPSTVDKTTCGFIYRNSAAGLPIFAGVGFIRFFTEDGVRAFPVPDGTQFDALVASQGVHPVSDFRESRD